MSCNVAHVIDGANLVDAEMYQLPRLPMRKTVAAQGLFQLRRLPMTMTMAANHKDTMAESRSKSESVLTRGACAPRRINNVIYQWERQWQGEIQ